MQPKKNVYILAAEQIIDGRGDFNRSNEIIGKAQSIGLKFQTYTIDPLKAGWNTPLENNHFRSGNSPFEAIKKASSDIKSNLADIAVISGRDYLKSEYSRDERLSMMEIYEDKTLIELYTQLACQWCKQHKITQLQFKHLAKLLWKNYRSTYEQRHQIDLPKTPKKWLAPITSLFRGVDCANPSMDYEGKLILIEKNTLRKLNTDIKPIGYIESIATENIEFKNLETIPEIAKFEHLKQVIQDCETQSKIHIKDLFLRNQLILEVYTCFPIIPLAFITSAGIATNYQELEKVLKIHPVTLTGGMNLAKAPWNNPALRAIIDAVTLLKTNTEKRIGIHGNGGLGEKQGLIILKGSSK